jgi:hypothetical protein
VQRKVDRPIQGCHRALVILLSLSLSLSLCLVTVRVSPRSEVANAVPSDAGVVTLEWGTVDAALHWRDIGGRDNDVGLHFAGQTGDVGRIANANTRARVTS